jgi:hypothetical protein
MDIGQGSILRKYCVTVITRWLRDHYMIMNQSLSIYESDGKAEGLRELGS